MSRQLAMKHEYVEYIPPKLMPGILYVSRRYSSASHLCCCGCGLEVVTPLNPAKWRLTDHGNTVSLYPSIGNWSFPCRSHYWVDHGRIKWAEAMTERQIAGVRVKDRMAAEAHAGHVDEKKPEVARPVQTNPEQSRGVFATVLEWLARWFK